MALLLALVLPVLLALAGAALDYTRYSSIRSDYQEISDAAAFAGAREYLLITSGNRLPAQVARDIAQDRVQRLDDGRDAVVTTYTSDDDAKVNVEITFDYHPTFLIAMFRNPIVLKVNSVAQSVGSGNICVIGLHENAAQVVSLDDTSRLSGNNCAVYANSTSQNALVALASARIISTKTCTSGGFEGSANNFEPEPVTDCAPIDDPLSARVPPTPPAGCDHNDFQVPEEFSGALNPGVYCGGLKIDDDDDVNVTFNPGIYFIRDGRLEILDEARVQGDNVSFYFYGDNAELLIAGDARVNLSAQVTGPMAGILMWHDVNATGSGQFLIKSGNVDELVGTIYLPSGEFIGEISGGGDIAESSAYTAIIAEKVTLKNSANLVLNSDYAATNVPVPAGLSNTGGYVALRQ